ncbi:MAG: Cytidylate kinaselike family [Gemmatimonadetes bacterium]|nr:Cytidylate kinaselike family [Gemmatimonadota bacterium]
MAIVTVSRMSGAGGEEVALRVAEALGWPLLDNAVVDEVAARLSVTREQVTARDERVTSLAERLANAMLLGAPESFSPMARDAQPSPSEQQVLAMTRRVVTEAVQRGPAVLVGRGTQCVLADRADALHVFCFASPEALAARLSESRGVSLAEAARMADEENRNRQQYVKRHWGRDWRAIENYHLCLDSGRLGVEEVARIVTGAARVKFGISGV